MNVRICSALAAAALLATHVSAANVPTLDIKMITQDAQVIAVGEVTDIKTLGKSDHFADTFPNFPFITRRATVKVFRGIEAPGAKVLALKTLSIDFLDYDPSVRGVASGMPMLPARQPGVFLSLTLGTHAMFPLKFSADAADPLAFHLLREDGNGLIVPAIDDPLDDNPAKSPNDFVMRELASPFVHGNVHDFFQVEGYLKNTHAVDSGTQDALLKSLVPLIVDRQQWVDIAASGFCRAAADNVTLKLNVHDLVTGSLKDASLSVPLFAAKQAGGKDLENDLLKALVAHQDELSPAACARIMNISYMDNPLLVNLERAALAEGDSGAIAVSGTLLKAQPDFALRAAALDAARKLVAIPNAHPASALDNAVPFLISFGSDDDAANLAAALASAIRDQHPELQRAILEAASAAYDASIAHVKAVVRAGIDATDPMPKSRLAAASANWRTCDAAGLYAQSASGLDFGLRPGDPIATRDQALERIREWLKPQR